tara:strand:+ start:167 stop:724 length:558 start_codon:yes stop_codon:yes gene_type:complete
MKTKNGLIALAFIALFTLSSATILNTRNVTDPVETNQTPNIVGVAVANKNFTTLVAAVKAADLVETLSSEGPFTVFAPTNDAFAKLPEGTIATLLKPENKATLTSILTYHVVAGKFDATAVVAAIKANNGAFTIKTVQGGTLVASLDGGNVMLKDEKGNISKVVIADVAASNGIIHAIDSVVMPK